MAVEVKVPELGESVVEATVAEWQVNVGDAVKKGDVLVELETDKVNLEVEAEADGVISQITANEGDDVNIGDVIAVIDGDGTAVTAPAPAAEPAKPAAAPLSLIHI